MTTPADILTCISEGRLEAVRARATALSHTLDKVEEKVREMQAAPPVLVEGGNTADLADLEAMRDLLDSADQPPTPLGLSEVLRRAEVANELHKVVAKALAETVIVRTERDALTAEVARLRQTSEAERTEAERVKREQGRLWVEAQDSLSQRQRDNEALRAQIADLTPGPWVRIGHQPPIEGETVLMWSGVSGAPVWMPTVGRAYQPPADYLWRRLPAALLALPETAETVAP